MAHKVGAEQKPEHVHFWRTWQDSLVDTCTCGYLRISRQEKETRQAVWSKYNQDLLTTPAYKDYLEMKAAFNAKNSAKIQEIKQRIETRGHWGENEYGDKVWVVDQVSLEKPPFPNPETWSGYVIKEIPQVLPF